MDEPMSPVSGLARSDQKPLAGFSLLLFKGLRQRNTKERESAKITHIIPSQTERPKPFIFCLIELESNLTPGSISTWKMR
jgi:hypothetical protein